MIIKPHIFRDYDVRAIVPDEIDMEGFERVGQATFEFFKPKTIAIGYDARLTGKEVHDRLVKVFLKAGVDVTTLGLITTDMMTFAAGKFGFDLAIILTASHNPSEYNGFKMATKGGVSVSGFSGFYKIRDLALSDKNLDFKAQIKGKFFKKDVYQDWVNFCLSFVKTKKIKPFKVVIDVGNGAAGRLFSDPHLLSKIPVKIIPLYFEPDGNFPNHIPNPLKMENLTDLIKKTKKEKADFGIGLDGDGDRIAFVTKEGKFVPGTIITALLAEALLKKKPGAMILYNAVCGRVVREVVEENGGQSKRVRVGYSLIEEEMKKTEAIFAGEHSCHFMYKDTFRSEASLLTFLLVLEFISQSDFSFSEIIANYDKYAVSGEINFEVKNKKETMKTIEKAYQGKAESIDWLDGITIWFKDGWVNVRPSNTQPLLRLNVEGDTQTKMEAKKKEFIDFIKSQGGKLSKD